MAMPPWKKRSGRPAPGRKLTPASIAWAKARARKAGRRYPNLIDNMAAAARQAEAEARPGNLGPSGKQDPEVGFPGAEGSGPSPA
jgi:hypothetical protein